MKYPAAGNANWNLSALGVNFLFLWVYGENTTPIGWQGNQPVIVLRGSAGSYTYTPATQVMPNFAWKLIKVPLAGDANWTRTAAGSPSLLDIDQIEIHQDTWDAGFSAWYDGVRFVGFTPGALPPAGPPPPAGVDPDAVAPRVLLYIINPVMTNFGNQRMTQVYGWGDPAALTGQTIQDLQTSSHGRARFQVVQTVDDTSWPFLEGGFQYTPATFDQAWTTRNFHPGTFDYVRFGVDHDLGARADAGEFDEVWVYAFPGAGMWESAMAGRGAYWVNGTPYPAAGRNRAFVIMGWNFERGVGEAIHSFGHRCESIMADKVYGQWCQTAPCNTWSRFALLDRNAPGLGGVGNVHFPVNGRSDYDYANPLSVPSNADAWLTYPVLPSTARPINFHEWSPAGADTQREYLNWWYSHMPHVPSKGPDQYLANWWRYLLDVDQFKAGGANLFYASGQVTAGIASPAPGASVSGVVSVQAVAEADGALGRVDFYIDGVYRATDSLAPFTWLWDTAGLAGAHTIVVKAYELQNGTEAASPPVVVTVCRADFNSSGAVTVQDIFDFLGAYFSGDLRADFNGSGAVSVQDVFDFLAAFFVSC